jgi:hypothetical protein
MSWIKLDDQIFTHPKVVELSKDAKLLYLAGLCYCGAQLTDGMITKGATRVLLATIEANCEAIASLVDSGLWEANENGSFQVHDYLEHQSSRDEVMAVKGARAKAGQAGGVKSGETRRAKKEANEANGQAKSKQIQIQNTDTESEVDLTHTSSVQNEGANAPEIVDNFTPWAKACWDAYPARNGKKLHKAEFVRALKAAPIIHRDRITAAIDNYAASSQAIRGYAEDPHRFIRHWQDWEQPETTTQKGTRHDHHTYSDPDAIAAEIARLTADPDVPGDGAQPVPFRRRA